MNHKLEHLFNTLETDRLRLLETVSHLSEDQFNRASEGQWSLHQILAHLITAEEVSIAYINKKILGIKDAGDTGLLEEVKMILIRLSQRLPFKFKAPKIVMDHTRSYSNREELMVAWEQERGRLKELLVRFDDGQVNKKVYRHIVAGRLNIQHALIFFHEHSIHHWPQIKRLL